MPAPLLLLIETSSTVCSVALSRDGALIALQELQESANHASMLTVLLADVMKSANVTSKDLEAVAISAGPGSYTGLRIGTATAKGLCYSLSIPLIAVDSLQSMAFGMSQNCREPTTLFCPAIDARRDEIYYGLFDHTGQVVHPSGNIILNNSFLENLPTEQRIVIGGDGAIKCRKLGNYPNRIFDYTTIASAKWLIKPATASMLEKRFAHYPTFEPNYIKPAFVTASKRIL